jgi:dTDP-glucose pyrophosphorylase
MSNSQQETTIILCAGGINYLDLPVGTNTSNAMIPVNGKPVIAWILDDLLQKGITQVCIVLRHQDIHLKQFLERAYSWRVGLQLAELHEAGSIVHSLQVGLEVTQPKGLARILLGDTLIRDAFEGNADFVYVDEVQEARRWCLAIIDEAGCVREYRDKVDFLAQGKYLALSGYYHLLDGEELQRCAAASLQAGERELSSVLRRYGNVRAIHALRAREWYDFGHMDNLADARRRLLQPRYFNTLTVHPVLNTITKVSAHNETLQDELDWYLNLPDSLKVLTPRLVSYERVNGKIKIIQEYYGYPTLAELYVYSDLRTDAWRSILRNVLAIHKEFRSFPGKIESQAIENMYAVKTWNRIDVLLEQDTLWRALLAQDCVTLNGQTLEGLPRLRDKINRFASQLAANAPVTIIHGDFCFSNILLDLNHQIIRLIDPRGRFGTKGIYGDARYDLAKLRHSANEFYDYILADMFELKETSKGFTAEIYVAEELRVVGRAFDQMLVEMGCNLNEVIFIEGLLFISMLPLHKDKPRQQRMMFLTGLKLLNEVL